MEIESEEIYKAQADQIFWLALNKLHKQNIPFPVTIDRMASALAAHAVINYGKGTTVELFRLLADHVESGSLDRLIESRRRH